jgi:hypothetical protein
MNSAFGGTRVAATGEKPQVQEPQVQEPQVQEPQVQEPQGTEPQGTGNFPERRKRWGRRRRQAIF